MAEISTDDLCRFLNEHAIRHSVLGNHSSFSEPAQLDRCGPRNLVWSKSFTESVLSCAAPVIILPFLAMGQFEEVHEKTFIFVDNPRDVFRLIVLNFFSDRCAFSKGLNDSRFFDRTSDDVWIGRSASIADGVALGNNVIIHPNVTIYPGVHIGSNVEILPGAVIGAPGFGHVRQSDGSLEPFPHIGGVKISDNVTIGSNTCIDSGGLSPTLVGAGVKIGNLTQIAHNVEIGENCLVGTRVQVAGGTKIGEGTEIWAGVTISNNRRIGRNCNIKIGSVVITNLPDGAVVSGNFAIPHDRSLQRFSRLRDPL